MATIGSITINCDSIEMENGENLRDVFIGDSVELRRDTGHEGLWVAAEFHHEGEWNGYVTLQNAEYVDCAGEEYACKFAGHRHAHPVDLDGNVCPRPASTPEVISDPEMEDVHYGISVANVGEEGEMVALGHHETRRALAAFNRHARVFIGLDNLADDRSVRPVDFLPSVKQKWAVFRRPNVDTGEDPDCVWVADWFSSATPGALPVTILEEV